MPEGTLHFTDDKWTLLSPRIPQHRCILPSVIFFFNIMRLQGAYLDAGFFLIDDITGALETILWFFFQFVSDWARHWLIMGCNSRLSDQNAITSVLLRIWDLIQGVFPSILDLDLVPHVGLCYITAVTSLLSCSPHFPCWSALSLEYQRDL